MNHGSHRQRRSEDATGATDIGELVLIGGLLTASMLYCVDAAGVSLSVTNLLLIAPLGLGLCIVSGALILKWSKATKAPVAAWSDAGRQRILFSGAMAAFLISMPLGFDISTPAFAVVSVLLLERRMNALPVCLLAFGALIVVLLMKLAFYIYIPTLFFDWL